MAIILNLPFQRSKSSSKPPLHSFLYNLKEKRRIQSKMATILNPPFWISNFRSRNRNQRSQKLPYIRFCAIWMKNFEFSQKWPPYWIRHFEFSKFDCRIIISDLKNLRDDFFAIISCLIRAWLIFFTIKCIFWWYTILNKQIYYKTLMQ